MLAHGHGTQASSQTRPSRGAGSTAPAGKAAMTKRLVPWMARFLPLSLVIACTSCTERSSGPLPDMRVAITVGQKFASALWNSPVNTTESIPPEELVSLVDQAWADSLAWLRPVDAQGSFRVYPCYTNIQSFVRLCNAAGANEHNPPLAVAFFAITRPLGGSSSYWVCRGPVDTFSFVETREITKRDFLRGCAASLTFETLPADRQDE